MMSPQICHTTHVQSSQCKFFNQHLYLISPLYYRTTIKRHRIVILFLYDIYIYTNLFNNQKHQAWPLVRLIFFAHRATTCMQSITMLSHGAAISSPILNLLSTSLNALSSKVFIPMTHSSIIKQQCMVVSHKIHFACHLLQFVPLNTLDLEVASNKGS